MSPTKAHNRNLLQGQDDGTSCLSVQEYLETRDGERPLGVYALYDAHNNVQYVGYSRNMVIAVKVMRAVACQGVTYLVPKLNSAVLACRHIFPGAQAYVYIANVYLYLTVTI